MPQIVRSFFLTTRARAATYPFSEAVNDCRTAEESMNNQTGTTSPDVVALTADIVSAYVSNNSISATDLPGLIASLHASITGLTSPPPAEAEKPVPPIPIKKSITPDYIISLEDGRQYKSLKRHLAGRGLTPAEYRTKWGLPKDYPMVSPNYAARRSEMAKASGLGKKGPAARAAAAKGKPRGRRKAA
jgi:predicted transcriptional regulator